MNPINVGGPLDVAHDVLMKTDLNMQMNQYVNDYSLGRLEIGRPLYPTIDVPKYEPYPDVDKISKSLYDRLWENG